MRQSNLVLLCAGLLLCSFASLATSQDTGTESSTGSEPGDTGTSIQGYTFQSNVSQHARIDLDQAEMERTTDLGQWSDASGIYSKGRYSSKTGEKRTLQGFSTSAGTKMKNEGYFRLFQNFWDNQADYADRFVQSGLQSSGAIAGKSTAFRAEIANKGSQYQNVWMYVIHELEDAIDDCSKGDIKNNDAGVEAWDEAWAFYTGSLAAKASGTDGMLLWSLAQKRCEQFGKCVTDSKEKIADANIKLRNLFVRGQGEVKGGSCDAAVKTKNEIVRLMTVPLIQGVIRYVYATKDVGKDGGELEKNHAEGWAFAAAVLPLVYNCDSGVGNMLIKNFHPENEPMKDSTSSVVQSLSSVYKCLGFTCADVGAVQRDKDPFPKCEERGPDFKAVRGTENPAVRNEGTDVFAGYKGINPVGARGKSGLSTGGIVGIIIAILVVGAIIAFAFFYRRSKSAAKTMPIQAEQSGSSGGPGEVFG